MRIRVRCCNKQVKEAHSAGHQKVIVTLCADWTANYMDCKRIFHTLCGFI